MPPDIMNESLDLAKVCFELARVLKWSKDDPAAEAEIGSLAEKLQSIAMERVHHRDTLGIDVPVVTRAIAYLSQAHASPAIGDQTQRFGYMLDVAIEVARPSSGLSGQAKLFLKDMLDGIGGRHDLGAGFILRPRQKARTENPSDNFCLHFAIGYSVQEPNIPTLLFLSESKRTDQSGP